MSVLMCPFCRQETVRFTHEPDKCVRCGRVPTEREIQRFLSDLRESEGYADVSYLSERNDEGRAGKSSSRKGRGSPSRMLRALSPFRKGNQHGSR